MIAGSVTLTVVTAFVSIASTTRPVPTRAAAGQHRRHNKDGQENQQGFSHCLAPFGLFLKPEREVRLLILLWNEGVARIIQCLIDKIPPSKSTITTFSFPTTQASRPDGRSDTSPGLHNSSVPSSITTFIVPAT